jgi:hypothetical protein
MLAGMHASHRQRTILKKRSTSPTPEPAGWDARAESH